MAKLDIKVLPAEQLKEEMLIAAAQNRTSDIHIDPTNAFLLIRFRIDGVLSAWAQRHLLEHETLISHLKILSELDITQHNIPQEGHFVWTAQNLEDPSKSRTLDVRVSFFPTVYGEAVVLRLFNRSDLLINLNDIGLNENNMRLVKELIYKPHGMVLVTGPAGSGKTTTLYSILSELASANRNIVTLEDPVEYYLDLVRQSQISPERDYTFAAGIRSVLRQDPDIMMVGEIRDFETTENAIRASLTGHMLLATLHTNSSIGTISRLLDMKVAKDLLAYSLSGVISQRLVRKNCPDCRVNYSPPPEILKEFEMPQGENYIRGRGCATCLNTGFKGRIGIFEVLKIDDDIKRMILDSAPISDLYATARQKGLTSLREDGAQKIKSGVTTPEEVLRLTL